MEIMFGLIVLLVVIAPLLLGSSTSSHQEPSPSPTTPPWFGLFGRQKLPDMTGDHPLSSDVVVYDDADDPLGIGNLRTISGSYEEDDDEW